MGNSIYVTMFDKFTITEEGVAAPPKDIGLSGRSRRLWTLVAYLILHKDRGVSAQELIDVLWPEDCGDNPLSTLQNNVSRARTALENLGLTNAKQLICNEAGMYRWAPDRQTVLDCEEFEKTALKALAPDSGKDALMFADKAIKLYAGDFLPDSAMESWCVHINSYYRSLYMRLCLSAVERLFEENRLPEIETICNKVIQIDPSAEKFSVSLMRALIDGGKSRKALEHYEQISRVYRDTYCVAPSEELEMMKSAAIQELYGEATEDAKIVEFLFETDPNDGAFYCDNNVFREIAKLRMRDMARSQTPCQLVAFALKDHDIPMEKRMVYMRRLESAVQSPLRSSDPYTRMSAVQILLLLNSATRENSFRVIDRVLARLHRDYPRSHMQFITKVIDLAVIVNRQHER